MNEEEGVRQVGGVEDSSLIVPMFFSVLFLQLNYPTVIVIVRH